MLLLTIITSITVITFTFIITHITNMINTKAIDIPIYYHYKQQAFITRTESEIIFSHKINKVIADNTNFLYVR